MAKSKTKKASNEMKQWMVETEDGEKITVSELTKEQAKKTGEVLFLQHGHYSNANMPVIKSVTELEAEGSDEDE